MKLPIYQVDAFSDKIFSGNPAAVVPLEKWIEDDLMQKIAMENNLAETVFFVKEENGFHIRWFTPAVEVDLCGHATLASAHVLFNHLNFPGEEIIFQSKSGELSVRKNGDVLVLNFPSDVLKNVRTPMEMVSAFFVKPKEVFEGKSNFLVVFDNEKQVRELKPDFRLVAKIAKHGVIVTAKGDEVDFVSRFFAPAIGVDEDPVTGSAHTSLIPYWSEKSGKTEMTAKQISKRGGKLFCKYSGERVEIGGNAITFLKGEIEV